MKLKNKSTTSFLKMTEHIQSRRAFPFLTLFLGFLFVVFIILLFVDLKPKKQNAQKITATDQDAFYGQSELAANLQHLQNTIEARTKQLNEDLSSTEQTLSKDPTSLARQNAPTLMYHAESTMLSQQTMPSTFSGSGSNESFANQSPDTASVEAKKIMHPETTLVAGELIHAILETAIQSDLPGFVRAVVTSPAYAYQGNKPLIPAGSRLMGQYAASIVQGQSRVMIIWNRIVLPNGITIQLNSPGADPLGRAGQQADHVDQHFLERFSQAALLSLIGAGVSTVGVGTGDQQNAADTYRTAIAESFQSSANDSVKQNENMKPTLHVYQGQQINVFVSKDVHLQM